MSEAWAVTQERLPDGWSLDGLRCASTGLGRDQRSEDWVAVAIGPLGHESTFRASDAVAALNGLADSLSSR